MQQTKITKIVTVAGLFDNNGRAKQYVFGPDNIADAMSDEEILTFMKRQVPNIGRVNSVLNWLKDDEETTDVVLVQRTQLSQVAQNKGAR